jgi:flagellar motility protein MotE (MotC chaperone)
MRTPRLLPLVAIAAGGVLAINAIENGPGIVGAARSFAEGVAPKSALSGPASALPPDATATLATSAQVVAAKPAPVCAESPTQLAKEAGLSPAELQVIQSLGARRGELDQREQGLSTELALIQAAEAKVDARIATMNGLKADMQRMVGQLDDKQQAEVDRLVKVFEAMINNKPQDAADRFVLLSDEVRLPIAAKLKERLLSAMIAKMTPPEAKRLTESLAARYAAQATAARAAINPPPTQAAAAASAVAKQPPAAKTAKAAQAAPDQLQPVADAEPAPKTKPAVHRKAKVTKTPAKTVAAAKPPAKTVAAAKPPEPVWPPKPAAGAPAMAAKTAAGAPAPAPKSATAPAATKTPAPKSATAPAATKTAASTPATKPAAPAAAPPAKSASSAPAQAPASGAPAKTG